MNKTMCWNKSRQEYERLTSQLYREYDHCKRVIDSCSTMGQLQSARQMALVNVPERWVFLIGRYQKRYFAGYRTTKALLDLHSQLETQLMHYWWNKVELNQETLCN